MTTIYLVRHAEAEGNISRVFQGRTDCDLTENGYKQLKAVAERFKNKKLDAIYSSPLKRTMETAKAVNFYHNLEIIKVDGLMEINGGLFEGQKWDELPTLFPEAYDLWANKHYAFEIEQGESMRQVYDRMKDAILKIVSENKDKTIAIVSHGCAIRTFLCYANRLEFEELDTLDWSENTGVCKLTFDDELNPSVIYQNDASHLKTEDMTIAHQTWWKKE
jgi:broad specificity phosphatase PhoE